MAFEVQSQYKSLIQADGGEGCNESARGGPVMGFPEEAVVMKVRGDEQKSS